MQGVRRRAGPRFVRHQLRLAQGPRARERTRAPRWCSTGITRTGRSASKAWCVKAPAAESDAYFASRNWQRRIGAWASAQSQPLRSREQLNAAVRAAAERFGAPHPTLDNINEPQAAPFPRPPFWGGYYVWADAVELWIEGASRIHERARWTRSLTTAGDGFQRRSVGRDAPAALRSKPAVWRNLRIAILLLILAIAAYSQLVRPAQHHRLG